MARARTSRHASGRQQSVLPLAQRPEILHAASIERMVEAQLLFDTGRWVMSIYRSGLAVEALLQAFAHRAPTAHDARHDLGLWLENCPREFAKVIRHNAADEWSLLNAVWQNTLRYHSEDGLVAHMRTVELARRLKGGRRSLVRTGARRCLDAARVIHSKGVIKWPEN